MFQFISSALGFMTHPSAEMVAPLLALHENYLPLTKLQKSQKQLKGQATQSSWRGTVHDIKQITGFQTSFCCVLKDKPSASSTSQDLSTVPQELHPQLTQIWALLKSGALHSISPATGSGPQIFQLSILWSWWHSISSKTIQACPSVQVKTFPMLWFSIYNYQEIKFLHYEQARLLPVMCVLSETGEGRPGERRAEKRLTRRI